MRRFLKNYTSDVPVSKTISRIEAVLIKCGVTGITKEYGPTGEVTAIRFHIPVAGRELTVRLPANKEKALTALWLDYADGEVLTEKGDAVEHYQGDRYSGKKKRKVDFAEQAERTAWKIVQDWIEVQMSMIQLNQADTLEVFLPYVWDGTATVYSRLKDSGFRALLPETAGT
jgi:hypothetical protein